MPDAHSAPPSCPLPWFSFQSNATEIFLIWRIRSYITSLSPVQPEMARFLGVCKKPVTFP